jgi:hypothetical protein
MAGRSRAFDHHPLFTGPFSGTASFDLPRLPKTAFVKTGNPVVGSEQIEGETFITQRHQFKIYTQQSGDIVIPAIAVRFSGKKSFTSDPEPVNGVTRELRFRSRRPPGTASMGVVVSVADIEIEQAWQPNRITDLEAGDVIQRTITRTAEETTAMMFPAVIASAPDGVRIYDQQPVVEDKTERGEAIAYRSDTIKYQFQQAGTFTLPEMTFVWWDPNGEQLKRKTLSGLTVNVRTPASATASAPETMDAAPSDWRGTVGLIAAIGTVALVCLPAFLLVSRRRMARRRPESRKVRELQAACASNDATAAYSTFFAWLSLMRSRYGADVCDAILNDAERGGLRLQLDILSQHLFAATPESKDWMGRDLWAAFQSFSRGLKRRTVRTRNVGLPPLNPRFRDVFPVHGA